MIDAKGSKNAGLLELKTWWKERIKEELEH